MPESLESQLSRLLGRRGIQSAEKSLSELGVLIADMRAQLANVEGGVQGETGAQGIQGIQGVAGVVGATGVTSVAANITDAPNVTTGETDLYSNTITAGKLANNGDRLEGVFAGQFAGHVTALAQIKLYFGGTAIFASGALAVALAANWTIRVTIIRVSTSVVRYTVTLQSGGLAVVAPCAVGELTGLTLANQQVLKVTAQASSTGAASNQITATLGAVSYVAGV